MINRILGWVPLIIYWTLKLSNADADPVVFAILPAFSLGIFLSDIFQVRSEK